MKSRYETLTGRLVDISGLTPRERSALSALQAEFASNPASDAFAATWTRKVFPLLSRLPAEQRPSHPLYLVAQDLELRLGVAQGTVAPPDYRDYLVDRIEERFGSRYKFCQATGIPQSFLSQVLSGSKEFSVETLRQAAEALELSLALLPPQDLANASRDEAATLTEACRAVQDEFVVVKNALDHLRRIRKAARRRAALEAERTLFEGVLERLAAPLDRLDDERYGVRVVEVLQEEKDRLERLLQGLREQAARVAESGPLTPRRGSRHVDRGSRSRV
ncbi:MAG: hypothetical protein KF878_04545 [Planctomycetes bacterium]|nr:hypothetical protein [Planctomycetota bacterium]